MSRFNFKHAACLCVLLAFSGISSATERFLQRAEIRDYLDTISKEHELDRNRLSGLFSRLTVQQGVLDLISRPAEKTLTWKDYQPIFINAQRINAGKQFYEEYRDLLEQAQQQYGVPAEIIAAIIGVETYYGRVTGKYGVLESLATLAFNYPRRAEFFRKELTEFILLSEFEGWATLDVDGSYAGAMGMPQFIASSYRQYAVDFDGNGERDLFNSVPDIVGSVANYLKKHGWVEGHPIAEQWKPPGGIDDSMRVLVAESLKPMIEAASVQSLGFESEQLEKGSEKGRLLSVMTFEGKQSEELWIGYANFYAITRYNHSRLYALAVFQLAEAIVNAS